MAVTSLFRVSLRNPPTALETMTRGRGGPMQGVTGVCLLWIGGGGVDFYGTNATKTLLPTLFYSHESSRIGLHCLYVQCPFSGAQWTATSLQMPTNKTNIGFNGNPLCEQRFAPKMQGHAVGWWKIKKVGKKEETMMIM